MLTPLTLMLLVSFFVSFAVLDDPDGTLATVVSFIPFAAPMTMPPRIALGEASAVEIAAAFAVTLAAAAALVPLAARIYSGAVLRTGSASSCATPGAAPADRSARGTPPRVRLDVGAVRSDARPRRPHTSRCWGDGSPPGAVADERVDLPQVAADALGHPVQQRARLLDPAGRRRELRLDAPDVLHRGQRALDLRAQRARVQLVAARLAPSARARGRGRRRPRARAASRPPGRRPRTACPR